MIAETTRRRPEQRRRGRRAPGLGPRGPGHQRRRLRHRDAAGAGRRSSPTGHYNLRQKIRFAWWGAEENGLVGSTYYAQQPEQKEVDKIDVMLDYDMLASANYIRGIYDGDGDDRRGPRPNPAGPDGSGKVEDVFDDWFRSQGLKTERDAVRRPLGLRRLHRPRHPAGGVFAGAEGVKTAAAGGDLRRRRGRLVRPVLPPDLRQPVDGPDRRPADHAPTASAVLRRRRREEGRGAQDEGRRAAEPQGARRRRDLRRLLLGACPRTAFGTKPHGGKPPKGRRASAGTATTSATTAS